MVLNRFEMRRFLPRIKRKSFVFATHVPGTIYFTPATFRLVDIHRIAMRPDGPTVKFLRKRTAHARHHDVIVYYIAAELFNFNPASCCVCATARSPTCLTHVFPSFSSQDLLPEYVHCQGVRYLLCATLVRY